MQNLHQLLKHSCRFIFKVRNKDITLCLNSNTIKVIYSHSKLPKKKLENKKCFYEQKNIQGIRQHAFSLRKRRGMGVLSVNNTLTKIGLFYPELSHT